MSEFIEVTDALIILNEALEENDLSAYIKTIIVNYDFFALPLYVSFDKGEQITLANDIQKKLYRDFVLNRTHDKTPFSFLSPLSVGLAPALITKTFRAGLYYWKVDDFYKNPIFTEIKAIPNKDKVVYCSVKLDDEEIQEIADKELKAKLEQAEANLKQAHARIAELERQLSQQEQEQYAPRHSHTNEALQALNDVINEFWQDPNNPPKQEFIKAHIISNYPSIDPSKALWIDKIIRHNDKK